METEQPERQNGNDGGEEGPGVNNDTAENSDTNAELVGDGASERTDEPFKKPAVFAAPSVSGARAGRKAPGNKCAGQRPGEDENSDEVSPEPSPNGVSGFERPDGPQQHVKPGTAGNAKAAPAGRFKAGPPLPYSEPPWGGPPGPRYELEILKSGRIVDKVPLGQRGHFVVGRLPVCDVSLEHPSISRYHAVLQFRAFGGGEGVVGEEVGFYAYDLGSTHGTTVNKNKIPPKTYVRLKVGHVLKFGGSTRLFILQGPESDEEAESELTVTELKERARTQRKELERRMMGGGSDDEEEEKDGEKESSSSGVSSKEDSGCSWGMADEAAQEEDENEENPFATEFHEDQEAAYLKDPKKALQGFYDREGEELEFDYEDKGHGTWLCRIKLPVDDAVGRQLVAEVTHSGKKKEAAVQCCLEACRMLEARGLLRQEAVSRKRKKKNWEEEDYYDSDDDTFLDRTGAVEKKRMERMKKAGKIEEGPETHESLITKLAQVEKEITETENRLSSSGRGSSSSSEDTLDAFMSVVRSEVALDGVERKKLHVHTAELRKEAKRLSRLVDLTRPTQLPSLQTISSSASSDPEKPKKPPLPLFGAMKGGSKFKLKTGTIGPPTTMSSQYPEDDPDYCVWVPPSGQTGDGRTHLNDKYGY
uniref:FHA domain-containing protein n=1 Tax=Denticeps clupeoides TaxID=299321 RepID=A0AAY4AFS1_9TELE